MLNIAFENRLLRKIKPKYKFVVNPGWCNNMSLCCLSGIQCFCSNTKRPKEISLGSTYRNRFHIVASSEKVHQHKNIRKTKGNEANAEQVIVDYLNKHDVANAWNTVEKASYLEVAVSSESVQYHVTSLKYLSTFLQYIIKNKLALPSQYYSKITDIIDSMSIVVKNKIPLSNNFYSVNNLSANRNRIVSDVSNVLHSMVKLHGKHMNRGIECSKANICNNSNVKHDHPSHVVYSSIAHFLQLFRPRSNVNTNQMSGPTGFTVSYDLADISNLLKAVSARFSVYPSAPAPTPSRQCGISSLFNVKQNIDSHFAYKQTAAKNDNTVQEKKINCVAHFSSIELEKKSLLEILYSLSLLISHLATGPNEMKSEGQLRSNDLMHLVYLLRPIVRSTVILHDPFSDSSCTVSANDSETNEIRSFLSSITKLMLRADTTLLSFGKAYVGLIGLQSMNMLHHKEVAEMLNVVILKLREYIYHCEFVDNDFVALKSSSSENCSLAWNEFEKCVSVVKLMDVRCKAVRELIRLLTELVGVKLLDAPPPCELTQAFSAATWNSLSLSKLLVILPVLKGFPGSDYVEIRQLFSVINSKIPAYDHNPRMFNDLAPKDILLCLSCLKNMSSDYVEVQDFLSKMLTHMEQLNITFGRVDLLKLLCVCGNLSSNQPVVSKFYEIICDGYGSDNNAAEKIVTTKLLSAALQGLCHRSSDNNAFSRLLRIFCNIVEEEREKNKEIFQSVNHLEIISMLNGCRNLSSQDPLVRDLLKILIIPSLEAYLPMQMDENALRELDDARKCVPTKEYLKILASNVRGFRGDILNPKAPLQKSHDQWVPLLSTH